jgi:hypothetical protein
VEVASAGAWLTSESCLLSSSEVGVLNSLPAETSGSGLGNDLTVEGREELPETD